MAPTRVLLLPALAALAAAQSLSLGTYVPECAPECINTTIDESTTCEAGDNVCICAYTYTVKRNSEACLRDACSDTEYGEVMVGIDEFCADVAAGPSPSSTTTSTEEPTTSPTQEPPTSVPTTTTTSATEEPPVYSTEEPPTYTPTIPSTTVVDPIPSSSSVAEPPVSYSTSGVPTESTTEVPSTTAYPTGSSTLVGTTSAVTSPTTSEAAPTSTPPLGAGARPEAGFAAVFGGFLVAALFSF